MKNLPDYGKPVKQKNIKSYGNLTIKIPAKLLP